MDCELKVLQLETRSMAQSIERATAIRYDLLDGMRGLASIVVLWLHIVCICKIYPIPRHAFLAVDFFFCLSGFVVAYSYANRSEEDRHISNFMRRRAARLMPLAIFGALLGGCFLVYRSVLLGDVNPLAAIGATILNCLLLPTGNLIPIYSEAFGADPPLWSLLQELLASFLFVLVLVRLRTQGLIIVICVAAYVAVWVAGAAQSLDFGGMQAGVWCAPVRVAYPFACGVLIQRLPIAQNRLGFMAISLLAVSLLVPAHDVTIQLISAVIIFPSIVYVGAGAQVNSKLVRIYRFLGNISYPLYVVNYPVIRFVDMITSQAGVKAPVLIAVIATMSSLAAALVAMLIVEPPIRRWLITGHKANIASNTSHHRTKHTSLVIR